MHLHNTVIAVKPQRLEKCHIKSHPRLEIIEYAQLYFNKSHVFPHNRLLLLPYSVKIPNELPHNSSIVLTKRLQTHSAREAHEVIRLSFYLNRDMA